MNRLAKIVTAAAVVLFGAITPTFAEELTVGQTEVLGFGGDVSDGGGATFGGGVQFAIHPRVLVAGEFGYLMGGSDFHGFGVDVDFHAISIDANARYLFPGGNSFAPYVLGGLGLLRTSASVSSAVGSAGASDMTMGLNVGGGIRWQAGAKWGVQPEVKVFVADGSNLRFSTAVYYQFGGR
jgi:opacity protein-like surface antigen